MKKQLQEDIDENTLSVEFISPAEPEFKIDWAACMEMVDRREAAMKQCTPCPKCGTMQVQLTNWNTDELHMKCRHCKHKFTKMLKPTPVGCEAYCACPACNGPGHEEWYAKGSPSLCTDGKIHCMTRPGYPVVEKI